MTHTPPLSLWDRSAEEADYSAPFDGDAATDIAIVGAGYTGLSTALHAAERGLDCYVLEARQVGYGGSGRNGTIHAAHAPKGLYDLARRAEEWRRLGAPVDLLSANQTADKIGSSAFFGGLLDRRAGTINPMGYVRGLARVALANGARISTGVRVQALRKDGGNWVLDTGQGRVRAASVVLATNAYTDGLWPGLDRTFTTIHFFQLATKPLGERVAGILRDGQGIWDTGTIMFALRRDAFGRLIVGSMGPVVGGEHGLSKRWAARRLQYLFPDLGPVEFEQAWHGSIAMTPDHLPRIHRLADGLYTPIAYNGRGIAPGTVFGKAMAELLAGGTVFGKAMAELLAGGTEEDLPLPISEPKTLAMGALHMRVLQAAFTANQWLKSL